MSIFDELQRQVDDLRTHTQLAVDPADLLAAMRSIGGDGAIDVVAAASRLRGTADRLIAVASAVIAELSARDRDRGREGLAATKGHRSPVALVQSISGGTKADAVRAVRLGESLLDGAPPADSSVDRAPAPPPPWHDGLRRAMLAGAINAAQHDAILRGLGAPPPGDDDIPSDTAVEVWAIAAAQLVGEAPQFPVEELARRARQTRDALDPAGAEERFAARYAARSMVLYTDAMGAHHGRIDFDDEMWAWVVSLRDAALRPRRGGPRFVDAADVFGARQPGVRMMIVKDALGPRDAFGRMLAVGHCEDGGDTLPGSVLDHTLCMVGTVDVTVDSCGNPPDVGREQRLSTPKQRIALALRDGGCRWPGCTMPASYCEAHHTEHWVEHGGRTDIDQGILQCRFHHLLLHNNRWRITRHGKGDFVLHPPPGHGDPVVMPLKASWKYAWDPPPPLERPRWRAA